MIPLIVMLAVGLLSALWPGPKLDHEPPRSGGIFAPHQDVKSDWVNVVYTSGPVQSFGACAAVVVSTDGIRTVVQCDGGTN